VAYLLPFVCFGDFKMLMKVDGVDGLNYWLGVHLKD
jgi:hypothetical protein